jgi:hypothetical protein
MRLLARYLLTSIIVIFISKYSVESAGCSLPTLDKTCNCTQKVQSGVLFNCESYLASGSNIFPSINTSSMTVRNAFQEWPDILKNNLLYLDMSHNKIPGRMGDLSNLLALKYLNLSFNQLTEIVPELSMLRNLEVLDLSHNQIEHFDFKNFLSQTNLNLDDNKNNKTGNNTNSSSITADFFYTWFSQLTHLNVSNNMIKTIDSLETPFLNMFYLQKMHFDSNLFTQVETKNLEMNETSVWILSQAIQTMNFTIPTDAIDKKLNSATFSFTKNPDLKRVSFNFAQINEALEYVTNGLYDYQYLTFSSIDFRQNIKIEPDCGIIDDIHYLVETSPIKTTQYFTTLKNSILAKSAYELKFQDKPVFNANLTIENRKMIQMCLPGTVPPLTTSTTTTITFPPSTTSIHNTTTKTTENPTTSPIAPPLTTKSTTSTTTTISTSTTPTSSVTTLKLTTITITSTITVPSPAFSSTNTKSMTTNPIITKDSSSSTKILTSSTPIVKLSTTEIYEYEYNNSNYDFYTDLNHSTSSITTVKLTTSTKTTTSLSTKNVPIIATVSNVQTTTVLQISSTPSTTKESFTSVYYTTTTKDIIITASKDISTTSYDYNYDSTTNDENGQETNTTESWTTTKVTITSVNPSTTLRITTGGISTLPMTQKITSPTSTSQSTIVSTTHVQTTSTTTKIIEITLLTTTTEKTTIVLTTNTFTTTTMYMNDTDSGNHTTNTTTEYYYDEETTTVPSEISTTQIIETTKKITTVKQTTTSPKNSAASRKKISFFKFITLFFICFYFENLFFVVFI